MKNSEETDSYKAQFHFMVALCCIMFLIFLCIITHYSEQEKDARIDKLSAEIELVRRDTINARNIRLMDSIKENCDCSWGHRKEFYTPENQE